MSEDVEDITLVKDYRENGNSEAIGILFKKYGEQLYSYLYSRTNSREDAEDLAQDAWLKAIKRIGSFMHGSFLAWLTVIARNSLIDRSRKRGSIASINEKIDEDGTEVIDICEDTTSPLPDAKLLSDEYKERIRNAVLKLPEEQKEVFLLRTMEDLSFAEIASMLSISINTALGRMRYAQLKLRKELSDL